MFKMIRKYLLIGGLLFGSFVLCLSVFKELRRESVIFNFFFPPSDIFVDLAETEGTILNSDFKKVEMTFSPKYPGRHAASFRVNKREEIIDARIDDFQFNIEIWDIDKNNLVKDNRDYSIFHSGGTGLELLEFDVPEELEINKQYLVIIQLVESKEAMKGRFTIEKLSDL